MRLDSSLITVIRHVVNMRNNKLCTTRQSFQQNADPFFPNVAPPPVLLEFKLQGQSHAGDDEGRDEQDVEEEYDEED